MACLEARTDIGEHSRIRLAQRLAASISSACGTTSLTKPSVLPSSAGTWRPVRIIPSACLRGMMRGSRCRPPASAASPTWGSGSAKIALSAAMIKSQASAISKPPPMAKPLTAAISGLSRSKRLVRPAKPEATRWRVPPAAWYLRSLLAENALSPAPVTIPTHCSGSAAKSLNTASNSACAGECRAL